MNDGTKVLSLRLANELAAEVANLARVEDVTISETIRAALYRYISVRRTEDDFKKRLKKRLEEDREILESLGG